MEGNFKKRWQVMSGKRSPRMIYAYKVCKIFVLCSVIRGEFVENIETVESRYFGVDELPQLATEKNNEEQIKMCFDAYYSKHWTTLFD